MQIVLLAFQLIFYIQTSAQLIMFQEIVKFVFPVWALDKIVLHRIRNVLHVSQHFLYFIIIIVILHLLQWHIVMQILKFAINVQTQDAIIVHLIWFLVQAVLLLIINFSMIVYNQSQLILFVIQTKSALLALQLVMNVIVMGSA